MPIAYRVIVMEDDDKMLSFYRRIFGQFPVRAYCTTNPEEALRVAFYSPPDIFITDLNHPGIDGLSMIKTLRANEDTKGIEIWVVSGGLNKVGKRELDKLHVNRLVSKPFNWADLIESIEKVLKSKKGDVALLNLGGESPDIDYKSDIDLETKEGRASFAKDVIAFANYGGGKIIVGVSEPKKGFFKKVGVSEVKVEKFEVTNLNKAIADYIDPTHHISIKRIYEGEKCFQLISIPGAMGTPLLARKENVKAGLFVGRFYTRTTSAETKEVTRGEELRKIVERAKSK